MVKTSICTNRWFNFLRRKPLILWKNYRSKRGKRKFRIHSEFSFLNKFIKNYIFNTTVVNGVILKRRKS